jgi:hypothetical protein
MKKNLLLLFAFCTINLTFGQYYVSSSIGQAIGSAEVKFGEVITVSESESSYGSYGEGTNFQIRTGYFFNDTFGVDFGFGYLHGADQTIQKVSFPSRELNAIARARAFGFTPSVVYKFTNKIYGRFGALIKLGGKTEAVVYDKNYIADEASSTTISQAFGLPAGAFTETNYIEDYHGKLPLGFVGAFGFKHQMKNNLSLFLEAEYMGVSVKRKDSEIKKFNTDVVLASGTVAVSGLYSIDKLPAGYVKNSIYVDELSNTNTDPSKKLAERVPYSSFGINFGITYTFSKTL